MRDTLLHTESDAPGDSPAMMTNARADGACASAAPQVCGLRTCDEMIELDVSGTRMTVLRSTLCAGPPTSILRRMFDTTDGDVAAAWRPPMRNGAYFFDHDAQHFAIVLNALRYGADAARFVDSESLSCVRGLAAYLGLYDIEAECAYALSRVDDAFDPAAHATIAYIFEDSLGDGDCRVGVGCLPAFVRVPRRWTASRALDTIADRLGMRRTHLRFYTARVGSMVLHDTHRAWSRDHLSIGAPIEPAATSTVDQFAWARHDGCAVFVARAPLGPRIALCKICDVAAVCASGDDGDNGDMPLPCDRRPFVFCLSSPGATAHDQVASACARAGIDAESVIVAYVEHQSGDVAFTRLAYPDPSDRDDDDEERTIQHVPPGDVVVLFVGSPSTPLSENVGALIRDLLHAVADRWTNAVFVDGANATQPVP